MAKSPTDQPGLEVVQFEYAPEVAYRDTPELAHPDSTPIPLEGYASSHDAHSSAPELANRYGESEGPQVYRRAQDEKLPFIPGEGAELLARKARKRRLIWAGIAIAVIVVIVVAVVVPVALARRSNSDETKTSQSSTPTSSAAAPASTLSTHGAFNGTGLGMLQGLNGANEYRLVFQHASGQLRQSVNTPQGGWSGGDEGDIVWKSGAKNGTPIATVSAPTRGSNEHSVLFVDENNILQHLTQDDRSQTWMLGSLGNNSFKVLDSPGAKISIAFNGNWHSPIGGEDCDMPGPTFLCAGYMVYWPGEDGRFREAFLGSGSDTWNQTWLFDATLDPAAGMTVWSSNATDWLFALDRASSRLTYLWRDRTPGLSNSSAHPTAVWVDGAASNIILQANATLTSDNNGTLYYRDNDDKVATYTINATVGDDGVWKNGKQGTVGAGAVSGLHNSDIAVSHLVDAGPAFQESAEAVRQWVYQEYDQSWEGMDVSVGD